MSSPKRSGMRWLMSLGGDVTVTGGGQRAIGVVLRYTARMQTAIDGISASPAMMTMYASTLSFGAVIVLS